MFILNSGEKLPGKSKNFVEADYSAVKNARKEIDGIWESYVKDVTDKTEAYEKIRKQLDSKMIFESVQPTQEELKALQEANAAYSVYLNGQKEQNSFDAVIVVDEESSSVVGSAYNLSSDSLAQTMLAVYRSGISFGLFEMTM